VADVVDRDASLPLLQYALAELFDRRRGPVIALPAYEQLGRVAQALVRRADSLYAELHDGERAAAQQAFLRLVDVAETGAVVRRRVARSELTGLGNPAVDRVLDLFGRHRLLTFDRDPVTRGPTVAVAHESLLSEWSRLRGWIDDGRDDLRQQRRLAAAAQEWAAAGRDDDLLVAGARLDQIAAWAAETDVALGATERDYVDASLARREALRAVERARQAADERLRRTSRRRSRVLVVGAAAMVLVLVLAIYAFTQRRQAGQQARDQDGIAEARRLAAVAADAGSTNVELGLLLALQSLDVSARAKVPATLESQDALHWTLQRARVPYPVADGSVRVRSGPDGPRGIYVLPLPDLINLARGHVTRTLTDTECARYAIDPCPTDDTGLASPATVGERSPPEAPPPLAGAVGVRPLEDTHVTIAGATDPVDAGLAAELDGFFERTGIRVSSVAEERPPTPGASTGWTGADILVLPQPGLVREHGAAGTAIDLSTYIDVGDARRRLGNYLVDANSNGAGYYGVPLSLSLKGVVWYPRMQFERAGYDAPATWEELVGLSRRMVADAHTPWCLGFAGDGSYSGWPGTDWIEALVLRLGGVGAYDRWVAHELPFSDPIVRAAMQHFGDVAFGAGFVDGGARGILTTERGALAEPLLTDPPGCWMTHQGSFFAAQLPGGATAGRELGFFALPPIEAGGPAPTLGGGDIAIAITDRPEVREFMRSLLEPGWGGRWAANKDNVFLSANLDFDPNRCRSSTLDDDTNDVRVALCGQHQAALAAGQWRYDASDQMPTEIGGVSPDGSRGAFLQGMLDYVGTGPDRLERVLAKIDDEWPSP
jgi:alpha-glucoside transport system substrate-binding protein